MNQKRTRVPLPHPPAPQESLLSRGLTIMISVFLIFTGALLSYSVIDGLIHDSITTATRGGPAKVYTLAGQPRMYWFHIVWEGFFALALLVAGVMWHRMTRIGRPATSPRRKANKR